MYNENGWMNIFLIYIVEQKWIGIDVKQFSMYLLLKINRR